MKKIKKVLTTVWNTTKSIIKRFPETLAIPFVLLLVLNAGWFIRENIDETAGVLDPAYLQSIVYASLALLVGSFMAFIGIKLNFKNSWKAYIKSQDTSEALSSNERFSLQWFFVIFISIMLVFAVLVSAFA